MTVSARAFTMNGSFTIHMIKQIEKGWWCIQIIKLSSLRPMKIRMCCILSISLRSSWCKLWIRWWRFCSILQDGINDLQDHWCQQTLLYDIYFNACLGLYARSRYRYSKAFLSWLTDLTASFFLCFILKSVIIWWWKHWIWQYLLLSILFHCSCSNVYLMPLLCHLCN